MNPNTDFAAMLEQALGILQSREASSATLRAAAEQARSVVAGIDAESERGPQRETEILARMASDGIQTTLKALQERDSEGERRAHLRKAATGLGAQIDARSIEVEAAERARDPAVQREGRLQALYVRVPTLFRTDFVVSKLGASAYSRAPRPQGRHTAYSMDFSVQRVLQDVMTATRVPGHWPPRYDDFAQIEQPNYMHEEIEAIVAPIRALCQKSAVSENEASLAIERAQCALLKEFARVCSEIRSHYQAELPRSITLPSIGAHAMAAE